MFFGQIRQQTSVADEGVVIAADIIVGFNQDYGWEGLVVALPNDLLEALDYEFGEFVLGELVDVVLVGDELHGYLVCCYSYKILGFAQMKDFPDQSTILTFALSVLESDNKID